MFCSSCGAPNPDTATFCSKCGAPLNKVSPAPTPLPQTAAPASPMPTAERKSPIVALVLNLFFGLGYLYLGYTRVLGLSTILFVVVALIVQIVLGVFTFGIASLLFAILLAYDGYVKADGKKGYIGTEPSLLYQ